MRKFFWILPPIVVIAGLLPFTSSKKNHEVKLTKSENPYQAVTGSDGEEERERWNQVYQKSANQPPPEPSLFLRETARFLPDIRAHVLVIPMEEGQNGVFLAKRGYTVDGIDYSDFALRKAKLLARKKNVSVTVINADITQYKIPKDTYDIIFDFDLHRPDLVAMIKDTLKPGGLVFYESEVSDKRNHEATNFQLNPGELRDLFDEFEIQYYSENSREGQKMAQIVARKRLYAH